MKMAFHKVLLVLWLAASQIDAFTTKIPHVATLPSMKKSDVQCRLDFLSAVPDTKNNDDTSIAATIAPKPHKRRERYSGRYPKNFKDKYKERQGDEETISKVLAKGMTPAGQHVPIMVKECLHYMGLEDNKHDRDSPVLVVDCTLGYGGHSSYILKQIMNSTDARLIAFDQDSVEIIKTEERIRKSVLEETGGTATKSAGEEGNDIFTAVNQNFAELGSYMTSTNQVGKVTSLLADLGLSSMQIDNNDRGFTYKRDGPLDMRMSPEDDSTDTAYQLLRRLRVRQLKSMLKQNSDEEFAAEIAFGLIGDRSKIPTTTIELADRVRDIARPLIIKQHNWNIDQIGKNQAKKLKSQLDSTIARVMQAIRIEVNGEFRVLERLLEDIPTKVLSPGGKVVILTFHSGEDRRVKKSFKNGFKSGIYSAWSRDVVRPTAEERRNNPRSSCCKLRWAILSDQNEN